jgi:response regulator of citrate/malate metabolism
MIDHRRRENRIKRTRNEMLDLVYDALSETEWLTAGEIARKAGVSERPARDYLNLLEQEEFAVKAIRANKGQPYCSIWKTVPLKENGHFTARRIAPSAAMKKMETTMNNQSF